MISLLHFRDRASSMSNMHFAGDPLQFLSGYVVRDWPIDLWGAGMNMNLGMTLNTALLVHGMCKGMGIGSDMDISRNKDKNITFGTILWVSGLVTGISTLLEISSSVSGMALKTSTLVLRIGMGLDSGIGMDLGIRMGLVPGTGKNLLRYGMS